ncbi:alkaline phosphatase family protein [uncultured Dokdonia sp.]|uniref:alkaline phosphatase family protein n=1 Tax=uncultured Dokdonia sp. TaxID=575653 RepID=UPI002623C3FF|nr:alkaline phosphatase family protein [uncultured Dokdonia sp.]
MGKKKLLLIGWDAADWKIIGPLMAKGQMPALKKMIENGVHGNISTMNPPYSPMLWTSVATGKTADKHGVLGFIEIMPDLGGVRPVTAHSRKTRAIWNILHNQGYKSNLVGWWPSHPAEPINGVVISDKFQKVNIDPNIPSPLDEETIHPKDVTKDFKDLRMFPFEITKEHILPFMPNAAKLDQTKNNGIQTFAKVMTENVSVHNAATRLLRTSEWDFMGVYYDLIDHMCHGFMKYHPPKLKAISEEFYDIYKDMVASAYRFQDMMLGRMLELIDENTTVIVMSDHGFESGSKRILKMPKVQAAAALEHRQFGMFVAMGPNIKKNEKVFGLGLMDIAPTILHHFGLPIGKDMDGKVSLDIFKEFKEPVFIDSWDTISGDFGELGKNNSTATFSDQDAMEQLIELGYIERPDEKKEVAILKTKCDLKHNLAKVYLGKKDYEKSKELLLELILEEDPIDVTPYYIDLINISLHNKDFEKAENYLEEVRKLGNKVGYNLFLIEAEIYEKTGRLLKALDLLEKVEKIRSNSEVLYRIGKIKYQLTRFEEAKTAFENAIKIESDRAKYHRAIAEVYIELGDYEEAVDYALTSIELVRFYPAAHFVLGRALEKLGDLENAKIAYETAERLQPKNYERSKIAKENVIELQHLSAGNSEKKYFKHDKNQIVVVSGLPRSGTSLMMQMLAKGGQEILTDKNRKADESNPKGYYEYDPVMSIHKDNSWLEEAKNKGVKIVAPLLKYLDTKYRYKIIFMVRDLNEVVKSQQVMRGKDSNTMPLKLYDAYQNLLKGVDLWKEKEPGVEMIYINYKEAIEKPEDVVEKVVEFIGKENLDKSAMVRCVDKKLYRNRSKKVEK